MANLHQQHQHLTVNDCHLAVIIRDTLNVPEQIGIRTFLGELFQCDRVLGHRGFSGEGQVGKLNLAGNHSDCPLSLLTAILAVLSYITCWGTPPAPPHPRHSVYNFAPFL